MNKKIRMKTIIATYGTPVGRVSFVLNAYGVTQPDIPNELKVNAFCKDSFLPADPSVWITKGAERKRACLATSSCGLSHGNRF